MITNTGMTIPVGMRPASEVIVGRSGDYRYFFQSTGVIEFECSGAAPFESFQAFWKAV